MAAASIYSGCGTALVTPFQQDLSLDEQALRRLVRRQVDAGINFLVPCGTTGENPTLSHEEHLRVVDITMEEAAGRVPVLAGCGGYNTAEIIELAAFFTLTAGGNRMAKSWGIDPRPESSIPAGVMSIHDAPSLHR